MLKPSNATTRLTMDSKRKEMRTGRCCTMYGHKQCVLVSHDDSIRHCYVGDKGWEWGDIPVRLRESSVAELQAENRRLLAALDDAETANLSAAVCSSHVNEFTRDGCLVCDEERACEVVEAARKAQRAMEVMRYEDSIAALFKALKRYDDGVKE